MSSLDLISGTATTVGVTPIKFTNLSEKGASKLEKYEVDPWVIKKNVSCSTHLSMKFILRINGKICRVNAVSESFKARKS